MPWVVKVNVDRCGHGPELLLVHGGAGPVTTWAGLEQLAARWTLVVPYRRGFSSSPPGPQDFHVDADDLAPLLDARPHVAAHSYGALGALLAAVRRPDRVRSLTIVEPPLPFLLPDDPEAGYLQELSEAVLRDGLGADPVVLRTFLRIAGVSVGDGPLPVGTERAVRRAHGTRPPREARPRLDVLRAAGVPALVASGDHQVGLERTCDALARALDARRLVAPGAGHFVAAAPGFAEAFEQFLALA